MSLGQSGERTGANGQRVLIISAISIIRIIAISS